MTKEEAWQKRKKAYAMLQRQTKNNLTGKPTRKQLKVFEKVAEQYLEFIR